MSPLEKAQLMDDILLKFEGNKTISWDDLREEFKDNLHQYHVVENHINFLIGQHLLLRTLGVKGPCVLLTDLGFGVMTDLENEGFVTKERRRLKQDRFANASFWINIAILLVTVAGLVVAIIAIART